MSNVDVLTAAKVLEELPPVLRAEELAVQRTLLRISAADALDTALRRALARLRYEVNRETFEYLRWKVQQTQSENAKRRDAFEKAAAARASASLPSGITMSRESHDRLPADVARAVATARATASRAYRDESGLVWTVTELVTGADDKARARCLVFSSEEVVTCRWQYPVYWNDLSDGLLDALRKQS